MGLGRGTVFAVLAHRTFNTPRHWHGKLPCDARGFPSDGHAFYGNAIRAEHTGASGPAHGMVREFLRRPLHCRSTLRPIPQPVAGILAVVDDGEQWQAHYANRNRGDTTDCASLLGRSRYHRATFVLSIAPPWYRGCAVRLYRFRQFDESNWASSRSAGC